MCTNSQVNRDHCWLLLRKLEALCPPQPGFPLVSKATADAGKTLVCPIPTPHPSTDCQE